MRMWPTPTASEATHGGPNARYGVGSMKLSSAAAMWPTPRANKIGGYSSPDFRPTLEQAAKASVMYPTPTTGAGLCGGSGNFRQLQELEARGEITPEESRSMAAGSGGQLNPDWVEALMGFPAGWTALEPDGGTEAGKSESPA